MKIESFSCKPLDNRCYVVWTDSAKPQKHVKAGEQASDEAFKPAVVIDPSFALQPVLDFSAKHGLQIGLIVNTHGHPDHVFNNFELRQATGARLCVHELDSLRLCREEPAAKPWMPRQPVCQMADFTFRDNDVLEFGGIDLRVIHTPGHTPGSSCLLLENAKGKVLFTGDTLFKGTFGRTDLEGGDVKAMAETLAKLCKLPNDARVMPGHGIQTTIASERAWMEKAACGKDERLKLPV